MRIVNKSGVFWLLFFKIWQLILERFSGSKINQMPTISINEYPQLSALCWNRTVRNVEEQEALQLYESGWRFIEKVRLTSSEQALITRLVKRYGNGVLNV